MRRLLLPMIGLLLAACAVETAQGTRDADLAGDPQARARQRMVTDQLMARGISDSRVLEAMRKVPRHRFVPPSEVPHAYEDRPLPIGGGQTISQPYIVAYMTEALDLSPSDRVLEIGTGSGYQAAILAEIVREVYTIEIVPSLAKQAKDTLQQLGYENVRVMAGDGYRGWPDEAPFDAIIVTAAPDHIPQPLIEQLALNANMVIPVGDWVQELVILTRTPDGIRERRTIPVRFVPMTGESTRTRD